MSNLDAILDFNKGFVTSKAYESFRTDRYPNKKIVIVTCMDTRLTVLLPHAMNLANGDAKIIKVAGAVVAHPFGSVMRSILIAIYSLHAEEIFIVGHHDCGMTGMSPETILPRVREAGISDETLHTLEHAGIDLDAWLTGFANPAAGVEASVKMIRNHPLLPKAVTVHGLVINPDTGKLDVLDDGRGKAR
jgi:carbonic anhydrase